MELSDILTYIGILIAILALSPKYFRLKLKLAPKFIILWFWISLGLLYLFSFAVVKVTIFQWLNYIWIFQIWWLNYIYEHNRTIFILVSIHFVILLIIFLLWFLRRSNQKIFFDLILDLVNSKEYAELFNMINSNIKTLIRLKYKQTLNDLLLNKLKGEYIISFNIDDDLGGILEWDIGLDSWYKKILHYIKNFKIAIKTRLRQVLDWFVFDFLSLEYSENRYVNDIFDLIISDNISTILAQQNEMLWFKIIDTLMKAKYKNSYGIVESQRDLEQFCQKFLVSDMSRLDSILSYQISNESWSSQTPQWWFLKKIIMNSQLLNLEKCIDLAISKLIHDDSFKERLNEPYSRSEYDRNADLLSHLYWLIELFDKIPSDKLVFSNTFYFLLKDLVDITDFSGNRWNTDQERNSGTSYLIYVLFDFCSSIISNNINHCWIYFIMLWEILRNSSVAETQKESVVSSFYYFLFEWDDEEILRKFSGDISCPYDDCFKKLISSNPELSRYFILNPHDRITHRLYESDGIRSEINDFIDTL